MGESAILNPRGAGGRKYGASTENSETKNSPAKLFWWEDFQYIYGGVRHLLGREVDGSPQVRRTPEKRRSGKCVLEDPRGAGRPCEPTGRIGLAGIAFSAFIGGREAFAP
jgi:hypothetical protein